MSVPSYIAKTDHIIPDISRDIRILYIESDYPNILDKLLAGKNTGSETLRDWLNIGRYNSFREAKAAHVARPLTSVYKSHSSFGVLQNSKYYAEQMHLPKKPSEPICITLDRTAVSRAIYFYGPNHEHVRFQVSLAENETRDIDPEKVINLKASPVQKYLLGKDVLNFEVGNVNSLKDNGTSVYEDVSRFDLACRFFYLTNADALDINTLSHMLQAFLESSDTYPNAKLILTGTTRSIPSSLAGHIQLLRIGAPSFEDIKTQLEGKLHDECGIELPFSNDQIKEFAGSMTGLTSLQLDNIYTRIGENRLVRALKQNPGRLSEEAGKEKKLESEKDGVIEFDEITKNPGIVGIGGFMRWINENIDDLINPSEAAEFGLTPPRGVILAGVPGTGKTQLAKQLTYEWWNRNKNASKIDFKIENLSSDRFGASEEKTAYFLSRISEQEPAVLLIDEIEKTFFKSQSNGQSMHEVRKQQMGLLLKWLQEHKENIFTFMTSNDIDILPPELIRSGRISERFFVFLPNHTELLCILYSQLKSRADMKLFTEKFNEEIRNTYRTVEEYCSKYGRNEDDDETLDLELSKVINNSTLHTFLEKLTENAINPQNDKMRAENLEKADEMWDEWFKDSSINMLTPFLTGADMGELLKSSISWLRRNKSDNKGQWTGEDLVEALLKCCRTFQPYGQTNMDKLVELYLSCDYKDASAHPILPRKQFTKQEGQFIRDAEGIYILGTAPDNLYDKYMQQALMREIEKSTEEERQKKSREERRDQIEQAQVKHAAFQEEQFARQRKQWEEDDADKEARKESERVSREIQKIQLAKLK